MTHPRRILIVIMFLATASLSAVSWSLGVEGGYLMNTPVMNTAARDNTSYGHGNDYTVSMPVAININDHISIESGISLSRKSWEYTHNYRYDNTVRLATERGYLEVPLLFVFSSDDFSNFCFSAGVGGYLSAALWQEKKGVMRTTSYDEDQNFNYEALHASGFDDNDRRLEYGGIIMTRLSYHVTEDIDIYIKASTEIAFTPLEKIYQENQSLIYNLGTSVSLGASFQFGEAE